MPVLPLEPFLSPDDLFDRPEPVQPSERRWWVLHTHPRAEKALARKFRARGLSFFLPVYAQCRREGMRPHTAHLPLFPGHLFLHGDAAACLFALDTNQVVRVLPGVDQGRLHNDLRRVHGLLRSGTPLLPEARLVREAPVVIVEGPFQGIEGYFLQLGAQARLVVAVEALRRGVSVSINATQARFLDAQTVESLPGCG